MDIHIKTIPHVEQRYPTCGDWWFTPDGDLEIRVSETGDWREAALVAFHELREVLVCKHRGISQASVDEFDIQYEEDRKAGNHGPEDEPGNDPKAPYFDEHQAAAQAERALAYDLDVNWEEYANHIVALDE
jgi:hypothetical protein